MSTTDNQAALFAEAMLAPLRDVGTMLAKAIDDVQAEQRAMTQHITQLSKRVEALEAARDD